MARVRQTLRDEEERAASSNIIVTPRGPAAGRANAQDQEPEQKQPDEGSAPAPSTRIPDTPNINATAAAAVAATAHQPLHQRLGVNQTQHLRIRNAIQREEVRTVNRAMKEAHAEMGQLRSEAHGHQAQVLHYREELRETRKWMQRSAFTAAFLFVCGVLYTIWCGVNSPEFEFQRKIVRRNLGLK